MNMITAKEAREIAMEMAQDQDWYTPIHSNRNGLKCHYYQVNDHVCFEYWKKHEWEFTIEIPIDDVRSKAYYAVIFAMTAYMNTIDVTMTKLPALSAKCRAQLTSIDKAVA